MIQQLLDYIQLLKGQGIVYFYVLFCTGICVCFLSMLIFLKSKSILVKILSLALLAFIIYLAGAYLLM